MFFFAKTVRLFILTWALFFSASAFAAINIVLTPKPNPPESGENRLLIVLNDEAGKPVTDAKINVLLFMPAMGTMPRMEERAVVEEKGDGNYLADFSLAMGGSWEIVSTIEKGTQKETYYGSLTTGIPGVTSKGGQRSGDDRNDQEKSGSPSTTDLMELGPDRLQLIGVRFAEAKVVPVARTIEAVGVVEQDQTHREEVTLRVSGYVVKQFRGRVGDSVKVGDPLFSIYSPDLVTAQSELFLAQSLKSSGPSLLQAATEKLKNLGLSERDTAEIKKSGKPKRDVVVRSKVNGTILEVLVREGAAVSAGQIVYVVGDLSQTYIVARVFQQDVGELKIGQQANLTVPGTHSGAVEGKLNLIYPQIEQGAGTTNVRVEVAAYTPGLRPGVYVNLRFPVELGKLLTIPSEAILYSGKHRYVFIDRGVGRLEPRQIEIGRTADELTEVISGLTAGDRVAASGTFLLGSEAQLRSALPKWRAEADPGADK